MLGQEQVVSVLEQSIAQGTISHAYLFAGSRGTGKTSIARILAREIGTTDKDLYEIDAASNRGIDEIRALREAVATLPFDSPKKVYIIDEAHMLTKEAWNALLKTLEEPPKHVVFIFATTELHKVPDTIQSRCLSFSFKKPTGKILSDMLISAAKKEGATLEKSGAELLAYLADGSYRDAYGMLEKAIAASGKKPITREKIEEVSGAPKSALVQDLITALLNREVDKALRVVKQAESANIDSVLFVKLILEKLRAGLLVALSPDLRQEILSEHSAEDAPVFEAIGKNIPATVGILKALLLAAEATPRSPVPLLPLEMAVCTICGSTE